MYLHFSEEGERIVWRQSSLKGNKLSAKTESTKLKKCSIGSITSHQLLAIHIVKDKSKEGIWTNVKDNQRPAISLPSKFNTQNLALVTSQNCKRNSLESLRPGESSLSKVLFLIITPYNRFLKMLWKLEKEVAILRKEQTFCIKENSFNSLLGTPQAK